MAHPSAADWDRRFIHRAVGVKAIYRTREYEAWKLMLESRTFCAYLEREEPERLAALQGLQHPSPTDRSLSKRAWERALQDWRRELRRLAEFCL